jgi:hypothetical protein
VACLRQTLDGRYGRPLTHSSYTTTGDTAAKGGQIYQLKLSTRGGALQLSGNYSTLIDILSRDLSSQAMRVRHLGDWIASMVTVGNSGEPTLSKQGVEASVTGSPA